MEIIQPVKQTIIQLFGSGQRLKKDISKDLYIINKSSNRLTTTFYVAFYLHYVSAC